MNYVIAYDLGTGGTKATLFNETGEMVASEFISCNTYFPEENFREQNPDEWWETVKESTLLLMERSGINKEVIKAVGVSGHSLGVVPISKENELLCESVPIWSDARAEEEENELFSKVEEEKWYIKTGNGFPARLYSVFKIMWYKKKMPNIYEAAEVFLGTKDYINFKLTGVKCTDYSYASGSGVFDLENWKYDDKLVASSGIDRSKMPEIKNSEAIIGTVNKDIARELGLSEETAVVCGGVDNACMALGANCKGNGESYTSLGTSAWIAVSSDQPIIDVKNRTYVFAHCIKGQYVSAAAIFSAGNSYRWVRDELCKDLIQKATSTGEDVYELMNREGEQSVQGSNKLLFNPSLAGGSSLDDSINIKGAYVGLTLAHKRSDMIRSAMEGIALNLKIALDVLEAKTPLVKDMLIVGGGAKSIFWNGLFADIFDKRVVTSVVGQNAGSLGAAALAFKGAGIWSDYEPIEKIHVRMNEIEPNKDSVRYYKNLMKVFKEVSHMQSKIGDMLGNIN